MVEAYFEEIFEFLKELHSNSIIVGRNAQASSR